MQEEKFVEPQVLSTAQKKQYSTPVVSAFGRVQDLTKSTPKVGSADNSGKGGLDKTG
jgi:hypothetical protein